MFSQEKLIEESKRILSIPSDSQSGNEELARYMQSLMQDLGFKVQLQPLQHSQDFLSKRQFNVIGFSSDMLVDRSTRRGLLMINPLDVTTGNLPHLWTATQGNPYAATFQEGHLIGVGALQGKIDFLCRILAATEILERRHKVPLYLVGTGASHFGMIGSRFMIESLSINPKEVITFAPTNLKIEKQSTGHVGFTVEIESAARDRDSRGYNRCVTIQAYGMSMDFSNQNSINAFELLIDLLMDASASGFDYQWSKIETRGAEGANPDVAQAQIYLTSFQFEDFKQFMRNKLGTDDHSKFFRVDFIGVTDYAVKFFSPTLIEVMLELDFEWKALLSTFNQNKNSQFSIPDSVGMLTQIFHYPNGKTAVRFEVRHLPTHALVEIENLWKEKIKSLFAKHTEFNFSLHKERLVLALQGEATQNKNSNYSSDAGWFSKSKFPVSIVGLGTHDQFPKGPNEYVTLKQMEAAIQFYREMILAACL